MWISGYARGTLRIVDKDTIPLPDDTYRQRLAYVWKGGQNSIYVYGNQPFFGGYWIGGIGTHPFSHQTTFTLPRAFPKLHLDIYDITGQLLQQQVGQGDQLVLNRGTLPSGLCIYRIYAEEQLLGQGKIVVQ